MKTRKFIALIAITCILASAALCFAGKEGLLFTAPPGWVPEKRDREQGIFMFDIGKRIRINARALVRSFQTTTNQTALEWAQNEAKALQTQGIVILAQPKTFTFGGLEWAMLEFENKVTDPAKKMSAFQSRQFFARSPQGTMAEVVVLADPASFAKLDIAELNMFLASVKFDPRSYEEAKAASYADYVAEKAGKAPPTYRKGQVIKGYLAQDAKAVVSVGQVFENKPGSLLYTQLTTLLDGRTVFGGPLINGKYKLLSVEVFSTGKDREGKDVKFYEVQAEILE